MTSPPAEIKLAEWETLGPRDCALLRGRTLDRSPAGISVANQLVAGRMLRLTELREGLEIRTFAHVGRIRLGDLTIVVHPKLPAPSLLSLVRYAYGLRRLTLFTDLKQLVGKWGLEELLIAQLSAEAQELLSRGLSRNYLVRAERLASPRGKIDVNKFAMDGRIGSATLPCRHHPRTEDTLLNRALLAGLRFAATRSNVLDLKRECRRLASQMGESVASVRLDSALLERADRALNRLTTVYSPALTIVRLLLEASGIVLQGRPEATIPGFLFDMNAFFQALLSRFLRENLRTFEVCDERRLRGMFRYDPAYHPKRRPHPTPRPDFAVISKGKLRAILDAKYRDLWEKSLPPAMLYQLVVYAISRRDEPQSAILYPTLDATASEERIDVADPIDGRRLAQVCLRPGPLTTLERLVNDRTSRGCRDRVALAQRLAFGAKSS